MIISQKISMSQKECLMLIWFVVIIMIQLNFAFPVECLLIGGILNLSRDWTLIGQMRIMRVFEA